MATKYILVGGYPHKAPDGGRAFCEELVKGFNEPVKILDCLYARPKDVWKQVFAEDKEFFAKYLPGKNLEIKLADQKKFIEQVRWSNVIYLRGGITKQLLKLLPTDKVWVNELDGKTLAGTSAGTNAVSKYYYGLSSLKINDGLGLLPVKVIVHWRSDYNAPNIDWSRAYDELRTHKENLDILTLAEGQFQTTTN